MEGTLRVEVFDGSDCVQSLFNSTNLRVRVTDMITGQVATRDVHEDDLEPWLAAASATYLLCASRETDLIDMLLQHASLGETAMGSTVILEMLHEDAFAANLLISMEKGRRAPSSKKIATGT